MLGGHPLGQQFSQMVHAIYEYNGLMTLCTHTSYTISVFSQVKTEKKTDYCELPSETTIVKVPSNTTWATRTTTFNTDVF